MNDDTADTIMRNAIRETTGHELVGGFVLVATVYDNETGEAQTTVQSPTGATLTEQMGLLMSALNRAKAIDLAGWQRIGEDDA